MLHNGGIMSLGNRKYSTDLWPTFLQFGGLWLTTMRDSSPSYPLTKGLEKPPVKGKLFHYLLTMCAHLYKSIRIHKKYRDYFF